MKLAVFLSLLACVIAAPHTIPTDIVVQSEFDNYGITAYNGIYLYKNGKARTLLDKGRSTAISVEPHLNAYLAAKDGIYFYDDATEKLEKYGTLTDSIIDIERATKSDDLYIITEDHTVYKVTEGGTKKTEITEAKGAKDIALDKNDYLFFYLNKQVFVINDSVKKVEGLPLLNRVFFYNGETFNGVRFTSEKGIFCVKADGTSSVYEPTEEEKAKAEIESQNFNIISKSIDDIDKEITTSN